jgi:NADH:ubiquinone oxidoreductase subunit 3 (subunit A)
MMDPLSLPDEDLMVCMQMSMKFNSRVGVFLWDGWSSIVSETSSNGWIYFTMILFVTVLCFIIEAMPLIKALLLPNEVTQEKYDLIQNNSQFDASEIEKAAIRSPSLCRHLLETVLTLIQKICTYLLMLCAMSFNFGIIIAIAAAYSLINFGLNVYMDYKFITKKRG